MHVTTSMILPGDAASMEAASHFFYLLYNIPEFLEKAEFS